MRKIKGDWWARLIIWIIVDEGQQQNFAAWGDILSQESVESRAFLLLV